MPTSGWATFSRALKRAEARQQYEQSHAIRLSLAETDPDPAAAQRNLATSFSKLGDISKLEGNNALARQHYGEALKRREALADQNRESATAQVDLATSYITLGNVSEPEEARSYYNQALKLRQALAAGCSDAGSRAGRERDVWITFNRLAEVSLRMKDVAAARQFMISWSYDQLQNWPETLRQDGSVWPRERGQGPYAVGRIPGGQGGRPGAALLSRWPKKTCRTTQQTNFMIVLARSGEHVEATQKAEAFRTRASMIYGNLFSVACCYVAWTRWFVINSRPAHSRSRPGSSLRRHGHRRPAAPPAV
jgi:tetratricopeptide (TPR) repeat protein